MKEFIDERIVCLALLQHSILENSRLILDIIKQESLQKRLRIVSQIKKKKITKQNLIQAITSLELQ